MLRNRLILAAAILATGVFASFYGGNIPYALFYLTLSIPVISFLYTFYVFVRVKVYQFIENVVVVKGQTTGYTLRVANEDFLSYQNLKIRFFMDMTTVEGTQQDMNYCLLPGESASIEAPLRCHYRGVYYAGARSIEVTDLFNLFHLTYPIRSRNTVTVLPRKVQLESLNILPEDDDSKNVLFRPGGAQDELDVEMRRYVPGDSRRLIHWKASARRGELLTRQYTEDLKLGIMVCVDLKPTGLRDMRERAELEDDIVESSLAIADYCLTHRTPCDLYYQSEVLEKASARTHEGFEIYYQRCGTLEFKAKQNAGELLEQVLAREVGAYRYIIITHELTGALYTAAVHAASMSNQVTVIVMHGENDAEQQRVREFMREASVRVVEIPRGESFQDVFQAKL